MKLMPYILRFLFAITILLSCEKADIHVIADLPKHLNEVSAVETVSDSDHIWVIEDSGNRNELYELDTNGRIVNVIKIENARNEDWEDLTTDLDGNIYIGDLGNNKRNRRVFAIYKVRSNTLSKSETSAEIISFKIPETIKPNDYESFFIHEGFFYIFSKNDKKSILIKVPNVVGDHVAEYVTEFNLKGKDNAITSADISSDGKKILLLNHDKLWQLTGFTNEDFFGGSIDSQKFEHNTQKEGICFKDSTNIYVTDELQGFRGGNLYEYSLD